MEEKASTSNEGQEKVFSYRRYANVVDWEIEMNTTNLTTKADIAPDSITFCNSNTWVMRITADRRIEVNKDVEVPDAAQAIFDALELFWRKKPWVGLTLDEKAYSNTDYAGKCAEAWQSGVEWAEAKIKEKNGG